MRKLIVASIAAVAAMAPSLALAQTQCAIGGQAIADQLAKVEGLRSGDYGTLRSEMRQLRSAAMVLQRYGKTAECQQVVQAMNELLTNPRASLDLRTQSMPATAPAAQNQTTQNQSTNTTTTTDPATTGTTAPANNAVTSMDQRRTTAVPFGQSNRVMNASDLIGADIYGRDNNSIAEIEDIVVGTNNQPAYAVVSFGGFLGMGEDRIAVPMPAIRISPDNYVFMDVTEEQLQGAPRIQRNASNWWSDENWRQQNEAYFNTNTTNQ